MLQMSSDLYSVAPSTAIPTFQSDERAVDNLETFSYDGAFTMDASVDSSNTIPADVPVFLQNTYRMIDSCDPTVASWSKDGTTFIIKDTERLGLEIIPQFFKHNKFSSFVRQLNFYGFRKVKADLFKVVLTEDDPKSWRFRHEYFVRGRPTLMRKIRRPNQSAVEREEVDMLWKEVKELQAQINFLLQHVQSLDGFTLSEKRACTPTQDADEKECSKKRRITPPPSPVSPQHVAEIPCVTSAYHPFDPTQLSDEELLVEDFVPGQHCSAANVLFPSDRAQPEDFAEIAKIVGIF